MIDRIHPILRGAQNVKDDDDLLVPFKVENGRVHYHVTRGAEHLEDRDCTVKQWREKLDDHRMAQ